MTSTPSETRPFDLAHLGTLVLLPWSSGAADGADMPYLLAYSLGDAEGGPETTAAAVEGLLASNGLTAGGVLVDGTAAGPSPKTVRRRRFHGRRPAGISYVFRARGFRPGRKSLSVASAFPVAAPDTAKGTR